MTGNSDCVVGAIFPFGSVYFSTSTREFWSRWSRPAGALIRRMVFHPLGGQHRAWLSIPTMFVLNSASHYDLSYVVIGDRAESSWSVVFGVLCFAALLEVSVTKCVVSGSKAPARWLQVSRGAVAHVSLRIALYVLMKHCLGISLSLMVLGGEPPAGP
eukprot:FR742661.1.p1 GENE.FR742661.1~~FR742661.1.p1  ORF type:complete len:169 (+),score=0.71 FR742661.1:34-507(+)